MPWPDETRSAVCCSTSSTWLRTRPGLLHRAQAHPKEFRDDDVVAVARCGGALIPGWSEAVLAWASDAPRTAHSTRNLYLYANHAHEAQGDGEWQSATVNSMNRLERQAVTQTDLEQAV